MKISFFKLVFAIIFSIPLIIWGFLLSNFIENKNLVNNGTKTTATVTNYYSNTTINDVPYYTLEYTYFDENLCEHSGKTSAKYTYDKAKNLEIIEIVYDKNFNSIEADFKFTNQIELIILPVLGLVSVGFIVSIIFDIKRNFITRNIRRNGEVKTATFVSSYPKIYINGVPRYNMTYEYTLENGETRRKTTPAIYSYDEQNFFSNIGQFEIRVLNNKSAVTEKIDLKKSFNKKLEKRNVEIYDKNLENTAPKQYRRCNYCGSIVSEDDKRCPSCGSKDLEKIK